MSQLLIALISWEVQLVKAEGGKRERTLHFHNYVPNKNVLIIYALQTCCLPGMSRWQAVSGAIVTVDLELLDAVHALQSSKTLKGNLGRASDKL